MKQINCDRLRGRGQINKDTYNSTGRARRVIKKAFGFLPEDITSDTNVKLASSGTMRALFCSTSFVKCVWLGVAFHISLLFFLLVVVSPNHPPLCTMHHPSFLHFWGSTAVALFFPSSSHRI